MMWKQFKRVRKDKHTPFLFTCSTRFGYNTNMNTMFLEYEYDMIRIWV